MPRVTRALVLAAAALAAAVLLACPPQNLPGPIPPSSPGSGYQPPEPTDHPDAAPTATVGGPAGSACTTGAECQSGVCEGPGCGAREGVCAATDRACTYDIQAYCGCDGASFDASGSCPQKRYAHRGACQAGAGSAAALLPAGAKCLLSTECDSGVCEGQGCGADAPGVCAAKARRCTRDHRTFCGCDGVTFGASGSCPGRRFASRGGCQATP